MQRLEKRSTDLASWRSMFGLREKLSLSFAGLLIIVLALGVQNILQLNALEESVDQILQEDFEAVIAADDMKEGLSHIDSGILSWLLGHREEGMEQIDVGRFDVLSGLAASNAQSPTPLKRERLDELESAFGAYDAAIASSLLSPPTPALANTLYLDELKPLFEELNGMAESIQSLNRDQILQKQAGAKLRANSAKRQTLGVLGIALVLSLAAIYFSGRWLLLPIIHLTNAAEEIRTGNLDVHVQATADDELGILVRTFNDMAERIRKFQKTQKARLLRSSAANQKIMDNLPDAIALVSPEDEIEMASRVAADAFGLAPLSLLGDSGRPWIADLVERAGEEEDVVTCTGENEVVQVFWEGDERFYFPNAVAIRDHEETLIGTLLIFRDITDLQLQQELKQDAIATVSHQLKTPLTSIQMALHMLRGGKFGDLNEKQQDLLETAGEESDRLLRMVVSLLDTSRIKSGRVMLECASMPLASLIRGFVDDVNHEAASRDVTMRSDLGDDIPEVWVDPGRVEHVFNNLLRNAVRYSPAGSEVCVHADTEAEWIRIDVRDNGPGIAEADCARIFEQFYRGAGSDTTSGAGLGLYIAKQIVEAHGGKIEVEGGLGQGACFSVWLPRADATESLGLVESSQT